MYINTVDVRSVAHHPRFSDINLILVVYILTFMLYLQLCLYQVGVRAINFKA